MQDCETCEQLLTAAVFGDLSAEEQRQMEQHLASCERCAAALREMQAARGVMAERERPAPPPAFWDRYWNRLSQRLGTDAQEASAQRPAAAPPRAVPRWLQELRALLRPRQIALALLFLGIGLVLGRTALAPTSAFSPPARTPAPLLEDAALGRGVLSHLARAKVLLLDVTSVGSGATSSQQTSPPPGVPALRTAARTLADESGALQAQLSSADQNQLRALLQDLRRILQQIAALENERDMAGIELIQDRVSQSRILLRIDLEELRLAGQPVPASASSSEKAAFYSGYALLAHARRTASASSAGGRQRPPTL